MKKEKEFDRLIGKTITAITRLPQKTCDSIGWYKRPVVIHFSDGSLIMPQSDDEGNDGGVIWYQDANDLMFDMTLYTT